MSRSNNVDITNPAEKFFKWSGSKGKFEFYDKDTKTTVDVPLPFKFIVLDSLVTIKGFSDANQSGFWSNEVREISKEPLTVYTKVNKKDIKKVASGLYNDIKGDKNITGAKYCESLYIAVGINGKLTLCNIQLTGSALSAWIDFVKGKDPLQGAIEVVTSVDAKKGATTYKVPVFTTITIDKELNDKAIALDATLQEYLKLYFKAKETEVTE